MNVGTDGSCSIIQYAVHGVLRYVMECVVGVLRQACYLLFSCCFPVLYFMHSSGRMSPFEPVALKEHRRVGGEGHDSD